MEALFIDALTRIFDELLALGYIGLFAISFFGSLLVFVSAPYVIPLALASLFLDPNLLALSAALGATLAKTIIFRTSYLVHRLLDENTRIRVRPFQRLVSRYGWLAALAASSTPIPDDLVFIPLGMARYSLWRFMMATFAGKLFLATIVAWGSRFALPFVILFYESVEDPVVATVVAGGLAFVTFLIIYSIVKLDWPSILSKRFPWAVEEVGER